LTAYAGTLLDLKKLVPAGDMYSKLLGLDPNNVVALNNYAWIRNELGHADALDYAERAYRIAPSSPEVADTFGWLMVKNGKLKDGLDVLRAAAGASPNNPDILYHLAYTLAKTGQNEDAIKILKVLLDKAGNFASRNEAMELYGSLT
jgi:tetratricopeptide (TPR) repeat protein